MKKKILFGILGTLALTGAVYGANQVWQVKQFNKAMSAKSA